VSSKSSQRKLGNDLLNLIRRVYCPDSLTAVLCNKLTEMNDRVKPALLELLCALVPSSVEYFAVTSNMKGLLQRLGGLLLVKPSLGVGLIGAVGNVVERLYHLDDDKVLGCIGLLPSDPQGVLKRLLVEGGLCIDAESRLGNKLRGGSGGAGERERERGPAVDSPITTTPNCVAASPTPVAWDDQQHAEEVREVQQQQQQNMRTPSPQQHHNQINSNSNSNSKATDPVLRYMVRPPLSEEKLQRDWMRETPIILNNLSVNSTVQDKYTGMQEMVQLARQQNVPEVWTKYFGQILLSLLEGIGNTQAVGGGSNNQISPGNSSPSSNFLVQDESAVKHLYLQGIRALLKYQATYFIDYIEIVVDRLLLCSRDSTYEIVHTAEKALENLAASLDSTRCLKVMTPYLSRVGDETIILSCMRTIKFVLKRCSSGVLTGSLPLILPSVIQSFNSNSVDQRKAVVFAIVEIYFVLGDALFPYLTALSASQMKLVTIYIERQKKNAGGGVPGGPGPGDNNVINNRNY